MIDIHITIQENKVGGIKISIDGKPTDPTKKEKLTAEAYANMLKSFEDLISLPKRVPTTHPRYVKSYDKKGDPRYYDPTSNKYHTYPWSTCTRCGFKGVEMVDDDPEGYMYRIVSTWCPSCGHIGGDCE